MLKLLCGFCLLSGLTFGQIFPVTANRVIRGSGAPASSACNTAAAVGKVYIRSNAAATFSTFYVCANTAAMTYAWELGGGGGSGCIPGGTSCQPLTDNGAGGCSPVNSLSMSGTVTTGVGGSTGGAIDMGAGTAPSVTASSVGFGAPSTVTTANRINFPNAVPAAHQLAVYGAPTSNVSTWAWKTGPDFTDTGGNHLNFTQSTDACSCGTSGGGGASFSDFTSGAVTVTNTGSDVTIYSYAAPALPAGACFNIKFYLQFTGAVATTTKIFVGATQIATPFTSLAATTDVEWDIDYCNQSGVQNAQYLVYVRPMVYGIPTGGSNYMKGSGTDATFNTPTAVDWSTGKTITIKTNAASDDTVGVFAQIHQH